MRQRATILFAVVTVVALGVTTMVVRSRTAPLANTRPPTPTGGHIESASVAEVPSASNPTPASSPRAAVVPTPTAPETRGEEGALMDTLRQLGETNPTLSLQLAREGNSQYPTSSQAPEREWVVVKSLVNLRRFDEAKAEAQAMVAKFPGTSWAADVERHLLAIPLYPMGESNP